METIFKTDFVISDEMYHDASSVHTFKERVVNKIKDDHPGIHLLSCQLRKNIHEIISNMNVFLLFSDSFEDKTLRRLCSGEVSEL